MQDRFIRGYISGAVGGVVMVLINIIFFELGVTESKHTDLISVIFLGHVPTIMGEQIIILIIQLGHTAIMGITFAYLAPKIKNEYFTFKGATYGVVIWFIIFSIGSLYKVPLFYNNSWITISSYLATSSIWGVITSLVLIWFEKRAGDIKENYQSSHLIGSPAYKYYSDENEESLKKLLKRHDKLLIQSIRHKQARNQSFLSRFKFW